MDFDFTLPGLGRPESSRPKRVAEAIRNELSLLLVQKVSDPRLVDATISQVMVTPDLKQAKVYFSVPSGSDSKSALKGLRRAKGFFRSHLAKALNLRHTPDLVFFYDTMVDETERIDDLFRQIDKDRKK